jgi:hypothetical protein
MLVRPFALDRLHSTTPQAKRQINFLLIKKILDFEELGLIAKIGSSLTWLV